MAFPPPKKKPESGSDSSKTPKPAKTEKSGAVPAGMPPFSSMLDAGGGGDPGGMGGPPPPMGMGSPPQDAAPPFPAGPSGLPFGGSIPGAGPGGAPDDGGSPMLAALMSSLSGAGGDPFGVPPAEQGHVLDGVGTGDPSMGLEQLIQLLALAQQGVGGSPQAGQSGVDMAPPNMGSSFM